MKYNMKASRVIWDLKYLFLAFIIFTNICELYAQKTKSPKTEVLLLGTFHFANPGLDVVKFEDANILSDKRQREVESLVQKLKAFRPDKIFVEVPVSAQNRYDSLLLAYKEGKHKLGRSETQQIGFRLAKECGINTIYCADFNQISFPIDSVIKIMMAQKQMDMVQIFQEMMQREQGNFNEQLKTKTITQILLDGNTDEAYRKMAGAYYFFLKAGDKSNHAGSFLASEQWRRNIYIYENILKNLDVKDERILVLYGTTHTAMISEMMKYNESLKIIPVSEVLK
jgi:hypothetical protein